MISLDLMKSSKVRIAGDRASSHYVPVVYDARGTFFKKKKNFMALALLLCDA